MAQIVDAKQYYGYLFEADKKPTKVLDALLRGIAIYIVSYDQLIDYTPCYYLETLELIIVEHLDRKCRTEEAYARQASCLLQGYRRQLRLFVPIMHALDLFCRRN